ncbi:MAG TPA: RICIN domain-containing protein [Streptosporangiaceae bacterium]
MSQVGKRPVGRAAAVAGSALLALMAGVVPVEAANAAPASAVVNLYVSPQASATGAAADGTVTRPFAAIAQAMHTAHRLSASSDVVVHMAAGTYRLTQPLRFTSADSGQNGHTITYAAPAGRPAVMTGAQQVTGWTLQNQANNIWVANVGTGTNTRQLYVNGAEAPRAAMSVPRSDFTFTSTGMTFTSSSLSFLDGLTDQNQIDVESVDSFTDRYAPVQSISGGTITMQQPAWANNTFGYDTLNAPFAGGAMFLENNLAFLQQAGQWAINSSTGQLFYKAASGQNPNSLDIELPKQQVLLQVSGSLSSPISGLSFSNMTFTGSTWLGPSGSNGYADQQAGAIITGPWQQPAFGSCTSGCLDFEATREHWAQMPAAVQVSAATNITFSGDTFTDLGEAGLGVGQDADANASGTGLGASNVTIKGNTFTSDAGSGIVVGGVQTDAHHPSNPAMTNQNISITNNHVTNVGTDYKEVPAILSTYVTQATISHNQVDHLPYDGIDIGWGWGMNDPGGSQDYVNRGTYNFQPIYTTPTTLKNNTVSFNLIFDTKNVMHDGGSIYNLSANPGSVIEDNYMFNNNHTVALYLDEGSRFLTVSSNVVQDAGVWAFTNANPNNNTNDSTFSGNWFNGGATQVATGSPHNNVLSNNVQVSGTNWPSGAQQVINQAGIQTSSGGGFPSGYHRLVIGSNSLCLDVFGNTTASGAAIDQWTCNGQSNQQFQFVPTSGGFGELQAQNSGDDVAVAGSSTTAGTPDIVQQPANGAASSLWLPMQQSDGSWAFKNQNSGLCLDVFGAGSNTGQQLDQWSCKNAPGTNQDFTPH